MKTYIVATFYKFVSVSDYETLKAPLLAAMKNCQIKGTIILASEGINGTFCGEQQHIYDYMAYIKSFPCFADLAFKESYHDENPFEKAKVKLRKEIVTMGVEFLDPLQCTGTHVKPAEWNNLINNPAVLVIDTRNDYEVKLGTFKGAVNPKTENFRDFPAFVAEHLLDKKDQKIAMCCTGGIRCEKSTAYLKSLGFKEVYQLEGGILNYLNSVPEEASIWEGSCFVFDERVALDNELNALQKGSIDKEWKNKNKKSQLRE